MNPSSLAPNVGNGERLICTGLGALLVWRGLRGGFGPLLVAGAGAALLHRGVSGRCRVYQAIGVSTVPTDQIASADRTKPVIDQIKLSQSFHLPARELLNLARRNLPRLLATADEVTIVLDRGSEMARIPDCEDAPTFTWECGAQRGTIQVTSQTDGVSSLLVLNVENPKITSAPLSRAFARHYLREALRRFKMWAEAGEVATTEGQPHGERGALGQTMLSLGEQFGQRNSGLWPTLANGPKSLTAIEVPS